MTQEILVSYRRNQKWINDAILRYKEQKELAYSISSPNLDGMPKAKNKINAEGYNGEESSPKVWDGG